MQPSATKHRLLLVDGDPKSLRVLDVSLKKAEFQVITATNGLEALAALEQSPDLIISDTHMPEMDGFELCRRIKQRPESAKIPFIFLSSRKSIEEKIRGLELGVEDYLSKPIYIKELITRVRMLLQRAQRERLESRRDSRTKFAGQLWDIGVVDLVQTIEVNRKSGIIHIVNRDGRRGEIYFRDGQVIDAEAGRLSGAEALYRLFSWNEGSFEVEFKAIRRKDTIELSPQALMMEGMRRLDEWTRLLEAMPPLETVFEVDYQLMAERLAELPEEVNGVLRLFDGRRALFQVIEDCDFPDLEALSIVGKLHGDGLIHQTRQEFRQPGDHRVPARLERWLAESGARSSDRLTAPVTPLQMTSEENLSRTPRETKVEVRREAPQEVRREAPQPPPVPEPRPPSGGEIIPFPAMAEAPSAPVSTGGHSDKGRQMVAHAESPPVSRPAPPDDAGKGVYPPSLGASASEPAGKKEAETVAKERVSRATVPGHATSGHTAASTPAEARNPFEGPEDTLVVALAAARRRRGLILGAAGAGAALLVVAILVRTGRDPRPSAPVAVAVHSPPKPAAAPPAAAAVPPAVAPVPPAPPPAAPPPTAAAPPPAAAAPPAAPAPPPAPAPRPAPVVAVTPPVSPPPPKPPAPAPATPPPAAAAAVAAKQPESADPAAPKAACRKAFNNGLGKYKAIVAACQPVLAAEPNAADVMVMMAEAELNRGRLRESREWAEKALAVEASIPEPWVIIGQAEQTAGRKKEAKIAYERYLELAPTGKYANDVRAIVPKL